MATLDLFNCRKRSRLPSVHQHRRYRTPEKQDSAEELGISVYFGNCARWAWVNARRTYLSTAVSVGGNRIGVHQISKTSHQQQQQQQEKVEAQTGTNKTRKNRFQTHETLQRFYKESFLLQTECIGGHYNLRNHR